MTQPRAGRPRHVVLDASAAVALLADGGPAGEWVTATVTGAALSAPELMTYEAANVLRRRVLAGTIDPSGATLVHSDLLSLSIDYYPYFPFAGRAWELRQSLTVYDASYIALAEWLSVPLVTLDGRLARSNGPRCTVLVHPMDAPS